MSLTSILKGAMSAMFGNASDDAPKAEAKHEPQSQSVIADTNSLTLDDIATLQAALEQMTTLTKTFGVAIYAYGQIKSPETLLANIECLMQDATELSEKSTAAITKLRNDCEAIRKNAIIHGTVNEAALRPIVIDVVTCYNFMMESSDTHLKTIATLQSIGPVTRADEIQTRFTIAIETGLMLYKDLTVILKKFQSKDAAPATEAGTPSRQP